MHLTRFTDIGLRALMYLAAKDREPPVTATELAQQFSMPRSHVVKVVHRLGQLGWVETRRGRSGGLRLAVPPQSLLIGDVMRALEGEGGLIDCAQPPCPLQGRCLLRGALDKALAAFYRDLNQYTLADVSAKRTGQAILQLHRNFIVERDKAQVA